MSARWRLACASAEGTSHTATGQPCQDSVFADAFETPSGPVLIAVVSDGAGSAPRGGDGSETACMALKDVVRAWLEGSGGSRPPVEDAIRAWVQSVHSAIASEASKTGEPLRAFACTLLGAVCSPEWSAFLQIGDGAIVRRDDEFLRPVFWPENEGYANQTHFVTDDGCQAQLLWCTTSTPVDDVALFSDGLQRLALNYSTRSAHVGFFDGLFRTLRTKPFEDVPELSDALRLLLSGPSVNARTDDDKSLVIASLERLD